MDSTSSINCNSMSTDDFKEKLKTEDQFLAGVLRNFQHFSRLFPNLHETVLSIDGFNAEEKYWLCWKNSILEIICDSSDQSIGPSYGIAKKFIHRLHLASDQESDRIICLVNEIVHLIPTLSVQIAKDFESLFPYWKTPGNLEQIATYSKNVLNLAGLVPLYLKERIIESLISKIVEIDLVVSNSKPPSIPVKLPVDENMADSLNSGAIRGLKFAASAKAEAAREAAVLQQRQEEIHEDFIKKLDIIMLTFCKFTSHCFTMEIGLIVLKGFEKHIFRAPSLSYSNYLMLHACSLDSQLTDRFLGVLLSILFTRDANFLGFPENSEFQISMLKSAGLLLGSFLFRAGFITESQSKSAIELILEWAKRKHGVLTKMPANLDEYKFLNFIANMFQAIVTDSKACSRFHIDVRESYLSQFALISPKGSGDFALSDLMVQGNAYFSLFDLPLCSELMREIL